MNNLRLCCLAMVMLTGSPELNAQQKAVVENLVHCFPSEAKPETAPVSMTAAESGPSMIEWKVLAPENGKPFYSDPFAKLTNDQLEDLSYVVRVRGLIAEEKIAADGVDAKEAARLVGKLEQQGVDIVWLMVQRERVRQIRGVQVAKLATSIAKSLQNKTVTLCGFVIPIKVDEGRLTEFFLVPTMAACSHEDAPPRLQVVFVSTEKGIVSPGRRTPVQVTGKIKAEATSRNSVNGSGRVRVHSAYAMSSPEIRVFQSDGKSDEPSER